MTDDELLNMCEGIMKFYGKSLAEYRVAADLKSRIENQATHDDPFAGAIKRFVDENQAVPDGWKLVPMEPSREMLISGVHAFQHAYSSLDALRDWQACYKAMLSAAPTPPTSVGMVNISLTRREAELVCTEFNASLSCGAQDPDFETVHIKFRNALFERKDG